jgi:hypothetical protein
MVKWKWMIGCLVYLCTSGGGLLRAQTPPPSSTEPVEGIPGVPVANNLKGIRFAVANMTGFLARALEAAPDSSLEQALDLLEQDACRILNGGDAGSFSVR